MNEIEKEAPVRSDASMDHTPRSVLWHVRAAALALVSGFALLASVSTAPAMASVTPPICPGSPNPNFCVTSFSNVLSNQDGTATTQAGSHPYQMVTSLTFSTFPSTSPNNPGLPTQNVKDVVVNLPPGLVGDPNAVPRCSVGDLDAVKCSPDSQVGVLSLSTDAAGDPALGSPYPLYNMVPPAGEPAEFGADVALVDSFLDVTVRTGRATPSSTAQPGDYGLTTTSSNISAASPIASIVVTLWGTPADPGHDNVRECPGFTTPCPSTAPLTPLLALPTTCTQSLTTTATVDSWQAPGEPFSPKPYTSVDAGGNVVGVTGCSKLSFNPSLSVQPDTTTADSPTGLDVDIHVPQSPDTESSLATPDLKTAVVTLPTGTVVSASAADGLQACSESQFGWGNASEPTCPNASKIGSAEIDSPIQPDPLVGGIYLAQQNANPFGSLLAIYVAAESDGVLIKLAGHVVPDPVTGQLVTTFDNNPQLPFSDFKLDFFGGARAAVATPENCGSFTATSALTPWNGAGAASPTDSFSINAGCVNGFSPSFTAGSQDTEAGAFTPFALSLSRSDTDQELSGLTVTLPPGLLADIASVPQCSPSANGSCPAASQVGTVEAGAGPGPHPFFLPGTVYLTGPYKGAPYGLEEVIPAIAGPLNLGTVTVRQALNISKSNAQVTVVSDPFPTILQGIPLRIKRIDVDLNRPNFIVNPTNCSPMSINATVTSVNGTSASDNQRFQVGGCGDLGFSPKFKINFKGKANHAGKHPTLNVTLTQPGGQANLSSVKLTLPLSIALDAKNSQNVCAVSAAASDSCPASTLIGHATANTPDLSSPLSGNVYLVQGLRTNSSGQTIKTLPALLVTLRGQIALDLTGKTTVSHNKLVTTFGSIPDAAISKFALTINGGSRGILVTTKNLCRRKQVAQVSEIGQNGKRHNAKPKISTSCHK
jgi:hypothetical protein